jgi:ribosome biogenesis GTPase
MNTEWATLGFDGWFEQRATGLLPPELRLARVTAVDRDAFLVRNPDGEIRAELAGKFRFTVQSALDLPCVGDWVAVQWPASSGPALIHQVLPRKTFLRRKTPGKSVDFQMIAANLDVAFIIQAGPHDFNIPRLERYLVMVNEGHIAPQIVLSKTDLLSAEELARRIAEIKAAGITAPILSLSNTTGAGLDTFRALLTPGKTYGLLGSSGVGKSTLINRLVGQELLGTKAVSGTGEGTHATTRRQLLLLDNGAMLIDTPGMRELGLLGTGDGMDTTFRDIGDYAAQCRFPNCTHTQEPGCAVLTALETGELGDDRYQSYLKLKKEADFHNLSYAEKRQKDRAFGKFIKTAKQQMRK